MKILHIGKYYPPFQGGTEKVNFDIVEALNKLEGFEVDELCFAHSVGYKDIDKFPYKVYRLPIRGIKFSTPLPKSFFSTYKKIRNNYDVIHIHLPNPIVSIAPLVFKTKAKIVLHWHCDITKQKKLKLFYNPIQQALLMKSSKIVVTSRKYADFSPDLKDFQDKIEVIPIGIDNSYLKYSQHKIDKIKDQYNGKRIVFSLGRLTHYKGFRYLIEAAKEFGDDTVVVIGGRGELDSELRKMAVDEGLLEKVFFIGRVEDEDLGNYYKAAEVFCLPSHNRTEAFGVVLLEAMSLGLPIVACNIEGSGVSWVNEEGVSGLNVDIENPHQLAAAINSILDDNKLRNKLSEGGIARYRKMFSVDKMVNSFVNLYSKLQ